MFLGLSLVATLVSVVSLFWGRSMGAKEGESVTNLGYYATFVAAGAATISIGILLSAFMRNDFTFEYVALNHSTDVSSLSWLFTLSGVWAGREGSLMFWMWLITLFGSYVAWKRMSVTDELSNMALAVTNIIQVVFLVKLFTPLHDPFKVSPAEWIGPAGELLTATAMNPLLQHWAMILHPPTLFIGYAGFTIPFAFAMAALITGDGSKRWVELSDRITVFSWLFLGIGIGLGAIWAYVVLGWGGYWAWDPVENASLIPWLTGVAMLHSFTVYRRRNAFKRWAIMMSTLSFSAVILGTFIVRSGVVQSVHAFQEDMLSAWIFGLLMGLPIVFALIGLYLRKNEFTGADDFESLTSKEASYYFNNVIMLLSAIVVALLTLSPALGGKVYGVDTYDAIAHPFGIIYVFIMAVCPLLAWRKTSGPLFWKKAKWPLISTAVLTVPLMAIWNYELWPILQRNGALSGFEPVPLVIAYSIVGLIVGAFAISVALYMFIEGARQRAKAKGESFGAALGRILIGNRTQSGGYITHLGIGIILIGLVGSAMFVDETNPTVPDVPGSQINVGGYDLTYQGITQDSLANGDVVTTARFEVAKGGRVRGIADPGQIQFFRQQQNKLNADVIMEPLRDIFIVFQGVQDGQVVLQVKINPLISWAWFGFLLTIIGTALAMWPKAAPALAPAPSPAKKRSK
jgi:cytochrome c-type biogenesis protein CcmF